MAVREGGREAVTHWEVLERYSGTDGAPVATLWRAGWRPGARTDPRSPCLDRAPTAGGRRLQPGFKTKAHQLGPNARDALDALGRQALHAYLLTIEHPYKAGTGVPLGTAG
jgi:23S rRNA pseudouridine1911/1915/1917 synthase